MANTNKYLSHLLQNTGITPACSEEERAAANDIADIFTAHGFQPEIQEFASSGSKKVVYAGLGLASFAGALLMGMGGAAGLIGVVMGVASAVLLLLERSGHCVLSQLGRGGLSQNVVAYHQASGPLASPRNRPVVVVAHYDSPRCDLLSREPFAAYRPMVIKFMPHAMIVSAVCGVVHMLPFPSAVQTVLWVVALLAGLLPLAYAVSVIANRFILPYTTGSVCNKSSVAAMLGVMDSVAPYQHGEEFPQDQPADEYFAEQRRIVEEAIAAAEADAAAAEAAAMTYPHEAEAAAASSALDASGDEQDAVADAVSPSAEPQADVQPQADVTTSFEAIDGTGRIGQDTDIALSEGSDLEVVEGDTIEGESEEAAGDPVAVDAPGEPAGVEVAAEPADSDRPTDVVEPSIMTLGEEPSGSASLSSNDMSEESAALDAGIAAEDAAASTSSEPVAQPVPDKPYAINCEGNIRFGERAIRSLGMLPVTCVIEYETHSDGQSGTGSCSPDGSARHQAYVRPVAASASVSAPAVAPIASPKAPAPAPQPAPVATDGVDDRSRTVVSEEPLTPSDATMAFEAQDQLHVPDAVDQGNQLEPQPDLAPVAQDGQEPQFSPVQPQPSPAYIPQPSSVAPAFNGDDGTVHEVEPVRPSLRELLGAEPIDEFEVIEPPAAELAVEDAAPAAAVTPAAPESTESAPADLDAPVDVDMPVSDAEAVAAQPSPVDPASDAGGEPLDPSATVAVETPGDENSAGTTQLFSPDDLADATVERTAVRIETEKQLDRTQQQASSSIEDHSAASESPASRPVETVDSLMAQISHPAPALAPAPAPKRHIDVPSTTDAPAPHTPVTANRASLFDLPDPSARPLDPFASDDQPLSAPSSAAGNGFSVVDTPMPTASPERFETITAPAPVEERPRKGLGKLFGRKKKRDDSMSDWLGVDDDFDAKSMGNDIGSWDNFEDDGWKGGATGSTELVEADLREAVASMGDDELLGHDIWFVATGASENGNAGIQSFLDAHRDKLRGVFLINLESVGAGSLAYLTTEGEERTLRGDRRISGLVSRVSSDFHHEFTPIDMPYVTTDAHAAMSMSLRSLTVAGIDGTGFALSHTEEDQPYNVEPENVALVSDVVTEVIRRS